MAKDKSKKKEASDLKIEKLKSKKESKKKDKKKDLKKKDKAKKDPALKLIQTGEEVISKRTKSKENAVPAAIKSAEERTDHSSDYTTSVAIVKLRTLKSRDEMIAFVKGEKRTTVTRVLPAVLNKLKG